LFPNVLAHGATLVFMALDQAPAEAAGPWTRVAWCACLLPSPKITDKNHWVKSANRLLIKNAFTELFN